MHRRPTAQQVSRLRKRMATLALAVAVGSAGVIAAQTPAGASAPSIIGFATNFDVANGTDKECEGFEIEIEDVTPSQMTYTYAGNPYGSAGAGVAATFPNGHSGIVVRYKSHYVGGAWTSKTPIGAVNHFGIHLIGTPGAQRYSWLCDLGGSSAGSTGVLTPYGGTTTGDYFKQPGVPAIVSRVVATPTGEAVQTIVIPAEVPEPAEPQFPDAVFVVKYQASSANPVDVDQLLATDPEVQEAIDNSQIASIAELFQPDPGTNRGEESELEDPIEPGDVATVTVAVTYRYTGPVNPVDNEVTCNEIPGDPNNCSNFIGSLIARQMVAVNLAAGPNRATLNVIVNTGASQSTVGGTVSSAGTANASPGEISCGVSCFTAVDTGATVNLTATPAVGYHLQNWSGACAGSSPTCVVGVSGLTGVAATFMPNTPTVFVGDSWTYEGKSTTTHSLKFPVVLSAALAGTTTVSYSTGNGTAVTGSDYSAKTGSLSIAAGKTSGAISVTVSGDDLVEGSEDFRLVINSVSGTARGTTQATATVLDDDTTVAPSVSVGDSAVVEGNSGTQNAVFTVTMSAPRLSSTPVQYETANGTATAGSDYVAKVGTGSIPAGAVTAKISILINGDLLAEGTETFKLKVTGTGSSGVSTDHDVASGKVLDDDTNPVVGVSIGDASVIEGDTGQKTVTLTVTLSSARATATTVKYRSVAGTAMSDGDFISKSGSLSILAGKVSGAITVVVNGDTEQEVTERFKVVIDSAGSVPLARPTSTVTVVDDE